LEIRIKKVIKRQNKLAEPLIVDKSLSLSDLYVNLQKQLKFLFVKEDNLLSILSNFVAAIKQTFSKVSWVGFYIIENNNLYLGPFQGKIACTNIEIGNGVCGKSAKEKKTIIVPDVNKFDGHIACDSETKSEIVVPLFNGNNIFAVLDLDSLELNSFSEIDKKYLENMCKFLSTFLINKTKIL